MAEIPTQGELYELFKNETQSRAVGLTDFEEGSNLDAIGGGISVAAQEVVQATIAQFAKTFFGTANGAAITGNDDDLQNLAVDHFGDAFKRPDSAKALVTLTFFRDTTTEGDVTIPAGTIVKTDKNSNGIEYRFETEIAVLMTGLSTSISARAIEGGSDSNVVTAALKNIETSLTDSSIGVTNNLPATGGAGIPDDPEYREFIKRNVQTLKGATGAAIKAAAENVPGVETATPVEKIVDVIEYDNATAAALVGAEPFRIVRAIVYISDANGTASQALIDDVAAAVNGVKACGVVKEIIGASPLLVDFSGTYSLKPAGPNFAELSVNSGRIITAMEEYIKGLAIGENFSRALARQAILEVYGPNGTDDLQDFVVNVPTGDVIALPTQKLIPGTVGVI